MLVEEKVEEGARVSSNEVHTRPSTTLECHCQGLERGRDGGREGWREGEREGGRERVRERSERRGLGFVE